MQKATMARVLPFAHLLGFGAKARRAEDDEEEKKSRRAEEPEDDEDEKKSRRAEEPEDDEDVEDDDPADDEDAEDEDDDKSSGKKGKKAKSKEEDDEDAEDGDDEDDREKAARRAERARCAAIFRSSAAGVRPDMAAHLAFNTTMSAKKAVSMLELAAMGQGKASRLADRMASVQIPRVGASGSDPVRAGDPSDDLAAQINAAAEKARGR